MPKPILLAVDLSYQTYRASSVHRGLTSASRQFTGGLYGFMSSVCKAVRDTDATRVVVCQDIKPYRRSEQYPEYKLLRRKESDPVLKQLYLDSLPLVLEFCALVGWPLMGVPGFESDDCIGHIVQKYRGRFSRIYAASNDSDLYQLFYCPWFHVFRSSMNDLVSHTSLHDEFGKPLSPADHSLMTALTGTHNDVAGIPRVGTGTALKAIRNPSLLRNLRNAHASTINRNLELIKLPHKDFPYQTELPPMGPRVNTRELYRWAARYDITVTAAMLEALQQDTNK